MDNNTEIRRRADGSIDIDHYAAIARTLHAETTRAVFRMVAAYPWMLVIRMVERLTRRSKDEERESQLAPAE